MSASAIFSLNDAMRYPLARLPQWVMSVDFASSEFRPLYSH
jgi:hypothetical protein